MSSCNEYVTKNKRIESFVQQVLDYFVRLKKEKSVDEINKNPYFLAYFRKKCIDEVRSYLEFQGDNEDYLKQLEKEPNKDVSKIIQDDSIEKIEIDFRNMLESYDITINRSGNVELPQKLLESIKGLSHFKEEV